MYISIADLFHYSWLKVCTPAYLIEYETHLQRRNIINFNKTESEFYTIVVLNKLCSKNIWTKSNIYVIANYV